MFFVQLPKEEPLLLASLLSVPEDKICFVETNTNDIIPFQNSKKEEDEEGEYWVEGYDIFNNTHNKILASNIIIIKTFDSKDNTFFIHQKQMFNNLTELCAQQGKPMNKEFIYKNIPIHEKAVSLCLDKSYNEITFEELKQFWKDSIEKRCASLESDVISEFQNEDIESFKEEIDALKSLFFDIKKHQELNQFTSKEEIISFWPPLLAPSPIFVTS